MVKALRLIHGLFALYFICCIGYIYYAAIALEFNYFLLISVASLLIEGTLVFILNHGDCPMIHLQRKIGDQTPFFELFLSKSLAKKAVPFFLGVTCIGLAILAIRYIVQ